MDQRSLFWDIAFALWGFDCGLWPFALRGFDCGCWRRGFIPPTSINHLETKFAGVLLLPFALLGFDCVLWPFALRGFDCGLVAFALRGFGCGCWKQGIISPCHCCHLATRFCDILCLLPPGDLVPPGNEVSHPPCQFWHDCGLLALALWGFDLVFGLCPTGL